MVGKQKQKKGLWGAIFIVEVSIKLLSPAKIRRKLKHKKEKKFLERFRHFRLIEAIKD
ncbi:MAG: hypothetical protein ABSD42_11740 [Candidatus Bathyarchaeia archaeon]|jgi:hypothetical protein